MNNKQIDILGELITEIARLLFKKRRMMNMEKSNFDIPEFLKKRMNVEKDDDKVNVKRCVEEEVSVEETTKNNALAYTDVTGAYKMSNAQREKLIQMAKSFNREEIELILDCILVEMMFNKIGQELERNRKFFAAINGAMTNY